jgi:quercetin dioxygenase-like cupin family protein
MSQRHGFRFVFGSLIFLMLASASLTAIGQQAENRPVRTVLQKVDVGTTGREASLVTVAFAPGAAEVPHTHPGEYIAYVLEGAFEFEVAGRPKAIYRVGDSFLVEGGRVHSGRNVAEGPTKLLITFILEKDRPASSPAK